MSFVLENENLVWQRVQIALVDASPAAQAAFKDLRAWFATQKSRPNLKFAAFDRTTNGSDGTNADTVLADAACKVVALYVKKGGAGTVAAFPAISDHTSAIQAAKLEIMGLRTLHDEGWMTYPNGFPHATGATFATVTAYNGTTHSLTADSADGFAILAAA